MDPIQNNGMSNYAMTAPQQQNDIQTPQDDYSSMPMVYDPTADEKKSSASSGLGMKALAALAIAGLAMWGGHAVGSKGAKAAKEAKAAAEDALAKANKATEDVLKVAEDTLKVAEDTVANAKKLQDANNSAYEVADKEFTGILDFKKDLRNGVKKALRPDEKEAKTTEDAIKKASEDVKAQREAFEKNKVQDAAEEAADAAKEGADNAAESAK